MLAKMYGSNLSIQGQIYRFKRLDMLGRGRIREVGGRNESNLGKRNLAMGFESMLGAKICSIEVPATSTPPRISCSARPGISTSRSVAPRRVTSASGLMTPTPRSKDEFKFPRGPNVNFVQIKGQIVKN